MLLFSTNLFFQIILWEPECKAGALFGFRPLPDIKQEKDIKINKKLMKTKIKLLFKYKIILFRLD